MQLIRHDSEIATHGCKLDLRSNLIIRTEPTNIAHVQCPGRSPRKIRISSGAYVATLSTCHFVHVQLDSNTCHSCSFYMDLRSLHDVTLRACSL